MIGGGADGVQFPKIGAIAKQTGCCALPYTAATIVNFYNYPHVWWDQQQHEQTLKGEGDPMKTKTKIRAGGIEKQCNITILKIR